MLLTSSFPTLECPLLSGIELAISIQKHRPGCKVLLFSTHANPAALSNPSVERHGFELIQKPVHPERFAQTTSNSAGKKSPPMRIGENSADLGRPKLWLTPRTRIDKEGSRAHGRLLPFRFCVFLGV